MLQFDHVWLYVLVRVDKPAVIAGCDPQSMKST